MIAFTLQVCLPPLVEELSLDLLVHVVTDQVLVLVVLVHEVHRVAVPFAKSCPSPLRIIVFFDFYELSNSLFKLDHVFGAVFDLLNGVFGSHIKSLSKNLKKQFGSKQAHMGLVLPDDGSSLSVHGGHIIFVTCIQLVHLPDEVISLVRK